MFRGVKGSFLHARVTTYGRSCIPHRAAPLRILLDPDDRIRRSPGLRTHPCGSARREMLLDRPDAPQRIPGRFIPAAAGSCIAFPESIAQEARGERDALSQDFAVAGEAEIEIGVADRHRQAVDIIRHPIVADDDDFLGRRLNDHWSRLNHYRRRLDHDRCRLNHNRRGLNDRRGLSQHGTGRSE
jgi:hypothetical protein